MMCAVELSVMDLNASSSIAGFRRRLDAPSNRRCRRRRRGGGGGGIYADVARMDDVRGAAVFRDVDDCVVTHRHTVVDDSATTVRRRRRDGWTTTRDATLVTMTSLDTLPNGRPE